jgi:class 3 adenylate cyclase/HAMP domain-containing protein
MTIRFYLTISYLIVVILMAAGMWVTANRLAAKLSATNLESARQGVQRTIACTNQVAQDILTTYGEALVDNKVAGVSRGLALCLRGKNLVNYAALRQDPALRILATQKIEPPRKADPEREGSTGPTNLLQAGFLMVYDNKGEILFFPDWIPNLKAANIEGKNARDWQPEYQAMQDLLERSFREDKVQGYYTYFDRQKNKERRRYTSRVHIPGTPFILAAQVNIDEYYEPAQMKIDKDSQEIMAGAVQRIQENTRNLRSQILLFTLVGASLVALLSILSGFWFAGAISRPLEGLVEGVQFVGEGDFAVTVPEKGVKEVKKLAQNFNHLGTRLSDYIAKRDFIRDTFSRYVTKEVVKKLLESQDALKMGGETREVSILMSDLRGFTAITATMPPELVIDLLNRYLGKMIEILLDNRAIIDEIVGDGILAFFGAPEPLDNHPAKAVATALQMQAAMEEINRLNQADGLPQLEMGVAINTGQVVVGNIGSERRAKYSVVGSHVNFTSRIEAYALGGQVIISSGTYEQIKDLAEIGDVVQVEVKGMPGLVTLYEVQGLGGDYDLHLKGKIEILVALPERLPVSLLRIEDKIVTGTAGNAWITELSETAARVVYEGELKEWEDVNVRLLSNNREELPGRLYGKVIQVKTGEPLSEAMVRFSSISADVLEHIRTAINQA